jgi:hypothetical protein
MAADGNARTQIVLEFDYLPRPSSTWLAERSPNCGPGAGAAGLEKIVAVDTSARRQ